MKADANGSYETQTASDLTLAPYLSRPKQSYPNMALAVFTGVGALFSYNPFDKLSKTHINFSCPQPWKRMLICQRAVRKAHIICFVQSLTPLRRLCTIDDVVIRAVKNENGVTGADILTAIGQMSKQWGWGRLHEINF